MPREQGQKLIAQNRRARHDYTIGETFEAGKLGEYTVGADGVVVLGDPTVFTAENIGESDF